MGSGSSKPPPSHGGNGRSKSYGYEARSSRPQSSTGSTQNQVDSRVSSSHTERRTHNASAITPANNGTQSNSTSVGTSDHTEVNGHTIDVTLSNQSRPSTGVAVSRPSTGKSTTSNRSKSGKRRKKSDIPETWELLTYLPPYGQDFEYSHAHFLYTNDLPKLEDVPPPHTAPTRKHEIFDPDAYVSVDERTDALKDVDLERPCADLVRMLTADYDDDISKIRALYRWFTSQPLERSDYKKNARANSTMFQLWHLKNKRNTYAGFFSLLCAYADIPCCIIRGFLKGSTYEVGQKINKDLHRGEWNAVLIDGNWRFINSFWGACVLAGDEEEIEQDYYYTCDENFFLTDPQQLIYTHFPEDDVWQLLDGKKSMREFETMVFLKDRFFNLEMRVLSHPICNVEAKDGEIDILFGLHQEKSKHHSFLCIPTEFVENRKQIKLKPVELPQKNVQLDFIHKPNDNVLSVKVRFPKVGVYKLEIVGKDVTITNKPDYDYDWVAIYKVNVDSIPEKQTFFPVLEQAGWGPNKILEEFGLAPLSHQNAVIKLNQPGPLSVKFKIVDQNKFKKANIMHKMIRIGDDDGPQEVGTFNVNGNVLETQVNVEPGEFKLKMSHVFGNQGNERNLCNYHVICSPPTGQQRERSPTPVDDTDDLRERLKHAIESQDLEKLERAVDLVESKGYAGKLGAELREARDLIARLKRLQKLIHEVMTLNQRTIAEIKSYSQPKAEIFIVMRGTLVLLGHSDDDTKDWKNVQAIIGKTGKMSLKRRIQELNVNKLHEDVVTRTKALINKIKLEDIVIISAGAATFYSWCVGMIEEFVQRQKGN